MIIIDYFGLCIHHLDNSRYLYSVQSKEWMCGAMTNTFSRYFTGRTVVMTNRNGEIYYLSSHGIFWGGYRLLTMRVGKCSGFWKESNATWQKKNNNWLRLQSTICFHLRNIFSPFRSVLHTFKFLPVQLFKTFSFENYTPSIALCRASRTQYFRTRALDYY